MLHDFLLENEKEILALTEKNSLLLAGVRQSSDQLKKGLPIFYRQLVTVLRTASLKYPQTNQKDDVAMAEAAQRSDEPGVAQASAYPDDAQVAESAGAHGVELLRLGYTLSHVVHAYGAICQAITEIANTKEVQITAREFRDFNRCLDVAIAGAVTEFQSLWSSQRENQEVKHIGFLAHELRNALGTVTMSLDLIRGGTVGFNGSVGKVLDRGLKNIELLIDRSLTEVRMRIAPEVQAVDVPLLQLVDQVIVTAEIEARARKQIIEIQVDPNLVVEVDQQLIHSAVSNLIQNAIKYTRVGGRIQVRGKAVGSEAIIEVEDECGGLSNEAVDLFKPFEQQNENRKGLGLGLTIAQNAIRLNKGAIDVRNLPGKGCVFKITVPLRATDNSSSSNAALSR